MERDIEVLIKYLRGGKTLVAVRPWNNGIEFIFSDRIQVTLESSETCLRLHENRYATVEKLKEICEEHGMKYT